MKSTSQFSYRILSSAVLALSVGLSACGGQEKTGDPVQEKSESEVTDTNTAGETIRIATEGAYPPMNFTNADGSLGGFDVEVATALCEQMKTKCDIVAQDWDGIIPGLKSKKYDAIIAGMSITDERKEVVDFTDSYFSSGLILIAKSDSDVSLEKADTIGAQRSTVASQFLADSHPNVKTSLYDTQENANLDLINGRLNALLVDQVVGTDWLSQDKAKGYEQKGDSISTGKDDFGIAVRKGDALAAKFNTALTEIKGNGTYEKITQKYFNKTAK